MTPFQVVGIDHVVHVVHDLNEAGSFFEALGFTVSGINTHPFGTQNRVVIFADTYLELITVADPVLAGKPGAETFSFSGSVAQQFNTRGQGFQLLALKANSYDIDKGQMVEQGLSVQQPLKFGRVRPDGKELRFTLFCAPYEGEVTQMFHCWHETPEVFYGSTPTHANGAVGVTEVFYTSQSPADHHEFLSKLTGQRDMESSSFGVRFELSNGLLSVYSAPAFAKFIGFDPVLTDTLLQSNAYEISVGDIETVKAGLERTNTPYHMSGSAVHVMPDHGFGAGLIFTPANM